MAYLLEARNVGKRFPGVVEIKGLPGSTPAIDRSEGFCEAVAASLNAR